MSSKANISESDKKLIISTLVRLDPLCGATIPPALIRVMIQKYNFDNFPLTDFKKNLHNTKHHVFVLKSPQVYGFMRSETVLLDVLCGMLDDFSFLHINKEEFRRELKKYNLLTLPLITDLPKEQQLKMMKDLIASIWPPIIKKKKHRSKKKTVQQETLLKNVTIEDGKEDSSNQEGI